MLSKNHWPDLDFIQVVEPALGVTQCAEKDARSIRRACSQVSTSALAGEDTKEGRSHGGLGQSLQRAYQEMESGSNQNT